MKQRNNCVYKNVCNAGCQRCRSCQLKFAPYDKKIAIQLEKEAAKRKFKFDDDRQALAEDIMKNKKATTI